MKNSIILASAMTLSSLVFADHHDEPIDLSGAMTTINVIAKTPSAYIDQLQNNTDMMSASGALLAGA